jgi:peroxiredoxin
MSERLAVPGEPMPTMTLPTTDGADARIGGGGTWQMVLVYRGRHCPLCRKYLKVLGSLVEDFKAIGFNVVAISSDPATGPGRRPWRFRLRVSIRSSRC